MQSYLLDKKGQGFSKITLFGWKVSPTAGKRCVHGERHRAEIQLRHQAAGLAAGAGLCVLSGAGL